MNRTTGSDHLSNAKTSQRGLKRKKAEKLHYPGFSSTVYLPNGRKKTTLVEYRKTGALQLLSRTGPVDEHTGAAGPSGSWREQPDPVGAHTSTATTPARLSYYDRKAKVIGEWATVRTKLLDLASVTETPPSDPACSSCNSVTEVPVRCLDCGPKVVWCPPCAVQDHRLRPYHIMEQWTVSDFNMLEPSL